MKKILLTTAAALLVIAPSTQATGDGFFAKVNLGYSQLNKAKGLKAKKAMSFGIGAGSYIMDNVRADLTFDHFVKPTFKSNNKKITGEVNTLLLNGFIDIFDISLINVFVGAGIGGSQVKAKTDGDNDKAKQKYNAACALYLGSSIEFAPKIHAELAYSYRIMGKTKSIKNQSVNFKGHNLSAGLRLDI